MSRWLLVISLFILVGCHTGPATTAIVNLAHLEPLPAKSDSGIAPLRVAVAAVISPQGTVESYDLLLEYLGQEAQRPVQLVQRRTYGEINELIAAGEIDLAFVCTSAYVAGSREFGMELLVAPQVGGEIVYRSLLIVPAGSPAQSMADLRGAVFAFTDPMSNTGRKYPTYLVQQLGETPETFFGRIFFTYSHDDAIRAVANHVAGGAAVDSLVYDFAVARDPELAGRVQVIHQSPPYGIPPVVAGPQIRPQLRAELEAIFLRMADDPAGQAALAAAGIDRFVPISDLAYQSVRELERLVISKQ